MKAIIFASCLTLSSAFAASSAWTTIAESSDCSDKIQIIAKEGESFIYAVRGNEKIKLLPEDKSKFVRDNMKEVTYQSAKTESGDSISFIQPSVVAGNAPKITVLNTNKNLKNNDCKMTAK